MTDVCRMTGARSSLGGGEHRLDGQVVDDVERGDAVPLGEARGRAISFMDTTGTAASSRRGLSGATGVTLRPAVKRASRHRCMGEIPHLAGRVTSRLGGQPVQPAAVQRGASPRRCGWSSRSCAAPRRRVSPPSSARSPAAAATSRSVRPSASRPSTSCSRRVSGDGGPRPAARGCADRAGKSARNSVPQPRDVLDADAAAQPAARDRQQLVPAAGAQAERVARTAGTASAASSWTSSRRPSARCTTATCSRDAPGPRRGGPTHQRHQVRGGRRATASGHRPGAPTSVTTVRTPAPPSDHPAVLAEQPGQRRHRPARLDHGRCHALGQQLEGVDLARR